MYYPSEKEFLKLAEKGNLVPVYKEILADLETPVSAYLKLSRDSEYSFLLESVEEQERIGRFSFLASNPALVFQSKDENITVFNKVNNSKRQFKTSTNPLDEIKRIMKSYKFVNLAQLPRFCGGLVGYIGYDCVRFFERLPRKSKDDLKLPDSLLILARDILIFDHVARKIKIISCAFIDKNSSVAKNRSIYEESVRKIEAMHQKLKGSMRLKERDAQLKPSRKSGFTSNMTKAQFSKAVKKAKGYIKQGDIIQVVLSQRLSVNIKSEPFRIYRNLRSINPSPYMFFLKFKTLYLIGSSPEMLVRCEDRFAQTRPIAGTRPRGRTESEDERLKTELLEDLKERCEHTMLVDLGRNDLGRVCKFKSVTLTEFMKIEMYSHVMHIVSNIEGTLKPGKDAFDLLAAAFPAGTVSGAPKVRAMEIIEELEATRRGPYAGCVGYFSFSGNLDSCITIRTIVISGNTAYVQAGAGIVADSKPQKEYQETLNKARAMLEAIGMD